MSKVKIKTLSAVHIGNGEFLRNNTDFVVTKYNDNLTVHVVDHKKILELIGENCVSNWVSSIERGENTRDMVKTYCQTAKVSDYSQRSIKSYTNIRRDDSLKEIIHDGRGVPYIPGSSIKGAIRTAILSSMALKDKSVSSLVVSKGRPNAKQVEKTYFGNNPNCDVFRFLKVGDAYFEKGSEVACRLVNLNIRKEKDSLYDASKSQVVEAIAIEEESIFRMDLSVDTNKWAHGRYSEIVQFPEEMCSLEMLFRTINQHTIALLEEEISFWNECEIDGYNDYLDVINDIKKQAENCQSGKECVLRIGHASGWRFMTGAWTEKLDIFTNKVVPESRPNNNKFYKDYDFPKTRRIDEEDGLVMGFVKLSLV